MNVLITGGLGNLGLWITEYFLSKNHIVTVISRSEKIKIEHVNYRFIAVDITDSSTLLSAIDQYFDVCIHAASYNEHFHENYTEKALKINALGTEYLCQALNVHGVGKLIYLSTFHVYGVSEGLVTEKSPITPLNDYGLTHFFAEKYIEKNGKVHGLNYTICRLSNSYGCPKDYNTDKWYLVLNDLCSQAIQNKKIILSSNGKSLRDFIWMGDVAIMLEKISVSDVPMNCCLNLSSNVTYSIFDIALYVQSAYKKLFGVKLDLELNEKDKFSPQSLTVSNKKITDIIPFVFANHFEGEATKILKMLDK